MSKRKYPKVVGYWVYSIKVPSINKYYIGVSKLKCCQRWIKATYETTVLKEYLDEWESMEKNVLVDNLTTKEEALKKEDALIQELHRNNLCINERRSGLILKNDRNGYKKELKKNNTEYHEREKQRSKQWWENNKEKYNEKRRQQYQKKKLEKQNQQ